MALKLHTRTTLLASALTITVLGVFVWLSNRELARLLHDEQRVWVKLHAVTLAEQIARLPNEQAGLNRLVALAKQARPDALGIRVWERSGKSYQVTASLVEDNLPPPDPAAVANALRTPAMTNLPTKTLLAGGQGEAYWICVPIKRAGRPEGAVEYIERVGLATGVLARYRTLALWLALGCVLAITLAMGWFFRRTVYAPIEQLLMAMQRVQEGDLSATVEVRTQDELGRLADGYNRMLAQVRAMTEEREQQRQQLEVRVAEATAELSERNAQLETLNRELWEMTRRLTDMERLAAAGQTAAQFAHEVGTPLNLISGHVQLLGADLDGNPKAKARLETISTQIERIERIVRTMLDRTRADASEHQLLDLNAVLRRTFELIQPALNMRRIQLATQLSATPLPVRGALDQLQQVFINIFNNAMDAMPSGGQLTVASTRWETGTGVEQFVIEVRDTGQGMPESVRTRIFEPFFTTKPRGSGTGLGLVVARQIVREHGGDITVVSQPERGTTVRLTFPPAMEQSL
jgi:two-component system NtrC family sensor kinase